MIPNSGRNSKRNLQKLAKACAAALPLALATGCFRQSAPERIPTAETLESCLAAADTLQFAHLSADGGTLDAFPSALEKCPALWKLSLRGQTALVPLSADIGNLKGLRWLDLSEMGLSALPDEVDTLPLQRLYLADNALAELPPAVAHLDGLDYLNLDRNQLRDLPDGVSAWTSLRWLRLNGNALTNLPEAASSWTALERLYLRGNRLEALPESFASLPSLQQLDLGRNRGLRALPDSIGNLAALTRLDLDGTSVATLPDSLGNLARLDTLVLTGCPMTTNEIARIRTLVPAGCRVEF